MTVLLVLPLKSLNENKHQFCISDPYTWGYPLGLITQEMQHYTAQSNKQGKEERKPEKNETCLQ